MRKLNVAALIALSACLHLEAAEVNDTSIVHFNPSKKRFHHKDCKRYKAGKAADPTVWITMTQKEGIAKGLAYCSRCPVDDSLKAGGSKTNVAGAEKPASKGATVHQDLPPGPLVTLGSDGTLVYQPYTDKGDRIMDFSHSGYKASEVPLPTIPTARSIEPLPDTPAPVRRPLPEVKEDGSIDQGPLVWFNNKKRFHDARCRRAGESIKNSPEEWTQIHYREGILSGLDYCSRCPKDAPRIDVVVPDPADHVPFMAYPAGPDSHARVQAALDEVGAMTPDSSGYRGAVHLKRGAYYFYETLHVPSGVVLRGDGDGDDGTVLVFHIPKGTGIKLGNKPLPEGAEKKIYPEGFSTGIADAYVPVGSASVIVKDASGLKVGDPVHVVKTTNDTWLRSIGMHPSQIKMKRPWKPSAYQLRAPRRIAAIEGNQITFDVPLAQGYVAEHGGGKVVANPAANDMPTLVGVEDLRVIGNYDRKVTSVMRAKNGAYEADEEQNLASGIAFSAVSHAWVRNCTVKHPSRNSFTNKNSEFITVRDCTSLEPISPIIGARRYCFNNSDSSMVLFYRNSAEHGRHPYVTGSRDSGPIAFVRGVTNSGLSETHSRWATGVLFDNIDVGMGALGAGNRGASGSGHGWAGANVVMWNSTGNSIRVQNPPSPEQNFALGCTVTSEAGEVSGDGFVYSAGKALEPESLFEQQLIDRIGEKQARAVLQ